MIVHMTLKKIKNYTNNIYKKKINLKYKCFFFFFFFFLFFHKIKLDKISQNGIYRK